MRWRQLYTLVAGRWYAGAEAAIAAEDEEQRAQDAWFRQQQQNTGY